MKKIIEWIINLFYKIFRKKKIEEENKRKEEEIIYYNQYKKTKKARIFGKISLGLILALLEKTLTAKPTEKPIEELIELDEILYEIRQLEKKESWLVDKIKLEVSSRKRDAYQKKLDNTRDNIKVLKGRAELIKKNRQKSEEVKTKLEEYNNNVSELKKELYSLKQLCKDEHDPNVLHKYQEKIVEIQKKIKEILSFNEKVSKKYDMNFDVIDELSSGIKEDIEKILPDTMFLSKTIVQQIAFENNKLKNDTLVLKADARVLKKELSDKEKQEKERIRKEQEAKNNSELNELVQTEKQINSMVEKQNKEIELLKKRVDKAKIKNKQRVHFRGVSKMFFNFSKLTIGFTIIRKFKNRIVGTVLGAVLINNGIRGLRNAIKLNKRRVLYYKYSDIVNEIVKQKSTIAVIQKLYTDSLKQTATLKKEFIEKFQDDLAKSPDYKEILDKLDLVEKEIMMKQESLKENKKQIDKIEKTNRNKVKVLEKKNNS